MKSGTPQRLVVTTNTGDHYIPLDKLVCIKSKKGRCIMYYINGQQQVETLTSTRTMNYYYHQAEKLLLPVHRNACVNPQYVSALLSSQKIKFSVAGVDAVLVSHRMLRKVRAALRKSAS